MRSIEARGTRPQAIQPPKGSLRGTPSSRTSTRPAPLPPTPRRLAPCVVGFATPLLVRRKRVNPGTWRRTSSRRTAAEDRTAPASRTRTSVEASTSLSRPREGVTVTVSMNPFPASSTASGGMPARAHAPPDLRDRRGCGDAEHVPAGRNAFDEESSVGSRAHGADFAVLIGSQADLRVHHGRTSLVRHDPRDGDTGLRAHGLGVGGAHRGHRHRQDHDENEP